MTIDDVSVTIQRATDPGPQIIRIKREDFNDYMKADRERRAVSARWSEIQSEAVREFYATLEQRRQAFMTASDAAYERMRDLEYQYDGLTPISSRDWDTPWDEKPGICLNHARQRLDGEIISGDLVLHRPSRHVLMVQVWPVNCIWCDREEPDQVQDDEMEDET